MGVTKRAARIAFTALLLGVGAATVAARPSAGGGDLDVVEGDPRLDLSWALRESGMSADDAYRVSVLLVDGVDPSGENIVMSISRGAELWWRELSPSGSPVTHMMRVRIDFGLGAQLNKRAIAASCAEGEAAFFSMRTTQTSPPPIPPGTVVLIRLLETWATPDIGHVRATSFESLVGDEPSLECQLLGLDLQHGIATPTQWVAEP